MIPVHCYRPGGEEPTAPVYFVVAANGVFLVNRTALFTSVTRTHAVPGLLPLAASLDLFVPRVPRDLMERLYGFFHAVWERWDGEAVAFLYYAPARKTFRVVVPPQTIFRSGAAGRWRTERRVVYGEVERTEGFVKLGDAHSHANQPAFFSCTDDADDTQDGLRLILGELHRRPPHVGVSFVAQGTRFTLRPHEAVEDFARRLTPPRAWLEQVTVRSIDDEGGHHGESRA